MKWEIRLKENRLKNLTEVYNIFIVKEFIVKETKLLLIFIFSQCTSSKTDSKTDEKSRKSHRNAQQAAKKQA